jgi:hypothetical protein
MTTAPDSDNPYVGPRPFRTGELLLGRARESRGVMDKLLGERIMLLHAPSGAGKTSLIQAALAPRMAEAGFQLCTRTVPSFSSLRVNAPEPQGFAVKNRYVYSAVLGLLGHLEKDPSRLADLSLGEALERLRGQSDGATYQVVIFDQLEEVLVLNPADREGQREFFRQVGEALDTDLRWALFSIREDYMGGLDRFTRYLPTGLSARYRLDFLERDAALQAIIGPAKTRAVDFTEEAARSLVDDLRTIRVQRPGRPPELIQGPYVEPVHLQVVCHRLWRILRSDRMAVSGEAITADQIEHLRDIAGALRAYYADAVRETARVTDSDERLIRDWFETHLITASRFRGQTQTGPAVDGQVADRVLARLERRYLLRSELRAGTTWYELTHDRLVQPVLEDNARWLHDNLADWQKRAAEWWTSDRDPKLLLLDSRELRRARHAVAQRPPDRTAAEKAESEYVARSTEAHNERTFRERMNTTLTLLTTLCVAEAIAIIVLLLLLTR